MWVKIIWNVNIIFEYIYIYIYIYIYVVYIIHVVSKYLLIGFDFTFRKEKPTNIH